MHFTKRERLGIFLVLIIGGLAFGAWSAFFFAMITPGVSDTWWPALWFALLTIFFFFGEVVWTRTLLRIAGATLAFLPGILFIHSWEFIVAILIAAGLAFWSEVNIARELDERVHFHFFQSVRAGKFLFVAGLSLALAGGYYVFLKDMSWNELVPRFRISEELTNVIFKAAGTVNPNFIVLADEGTTVDDFLLDIGQEQDGGLLFSDINQAKMGQELFLRSGREQLASLFGQPVAGDEKMSSAFSSALQRKLISLSEGSNITSHTSVRTILFFLVTLLFFTLLPLLSLASVLCIVAAYLIFRLALLMQWLTIDTLTIKQEKLAE